MAEEKQAEPGLGPEAWLKMWDGGWTHDHPGGKEEPSSCGEGHEHSEHEHEHEHSHSDAFFKRNLSKLTGDDTGKTIFVSLCGDSGDLEWLCGLGYSVVGAELSETAVKKIFNRKEQETIPNEVTVDGELKVYSATDGKNLKVYVGNFFSDAMSPEKLGTFDCIWDSHGIVSLPVAQHEPYAKKLATFLKPKGKILYSTVEYDIKKLKKGPAPAPVPLSRLQEFYPQCEVTLLENEPFPIPELEGVDKWSNPIVLISF